MAAPRVTIDQLPEQTVATSADLFVVQNGTTTKKMTVARVLDYGTTNLNTHLATVVDAHDASAISAVANADPLLGADVQTQLSQAASRLNSNTTLITNNTTAISNHIALATGAHAATAISTTAIAGVTGINVQAMLANLAARVAVLESKVP